MPTVAGYVRVSSEQQADNLSIPTQIRLLTDHAERAGWAVPTIYEVARAQRDG